MKKRVVVHLAIRQKYAEWRRTLPGSNADRDLLLEDYFTILANEAVQRHTRKPDPRGFWLEGPANSWFRV